MTASAQDRLSPPQTLLEVLDQHATRQGDSRAFTFLLDGESESLAWSFAEVRAVVQGVAANLLEKVQPGSRALLLFPDGPEFIAGFLGCLTAGVIPVPAFLPQSRRSFRAKLAAILQDSGSQTILARSSDFDGIRNWLAESTDIAPVKLLEVDLRIASPKPNRQSFKQPKPDDIAFLQYTSGSTGDPKGVVVTHQNLIANERAIQQAFGQTSDSVIVGWLPFHHDMGLIGNILQPLFVGAHAVLMPPMAMLAKPIRWLKAIDRYRATTSGGPNFAYNHCIRRISETQKASLDLSSWQVAFNGAEPIQASSLDEFAAYFQAQGFQEQAFLPCYGLAEVTLFASGGALHSPPQRLDVSAELLEQNQISTTADTYKQTLVSSGTAARDTDIRIVDPQTSKLLPTDHVGEIWLAGSSVTQGYWQQTEHHNYQGSIAAIPETRFLRTGDLGFLHEGELFVTGRLKEILIVHGKNHYPQDIERTVQTSAAGLVQGGGAVFQTESNGVLQLVVVQEVARTALRKLDKTAVCAQIRAAISEIHGLKVHEIVLIKPASLPKTTSGKIQRHRCKQQFLENELRAVASVRWADSSPAVEAAPEIDPSSWPHLRPEQVHLQVLNYLKFVAAQALSLPADQLSAQTSLGSLGLDSMAAITLQHRIQADLGMDLALPDMLATTSMEDLAQRISQQEGQTKHSEKAPYWPANSLLQLSQNQQSLWRHQQHFPQSNAYNLCLPLLINAPLDETCFARAIHLLGDAHPMLRCRFFEQEGHPVQGYTEQPLECMISGQTWPSLELLEPHLQEIMVAPFRLDDGASRLHLFRLTDGRYVFLAVVHHVVADFWSLSLLLNDLGRFYTAAKLAQDVTTTPKHNTYASFIARQNRADWTADRTFWQDRLSGSSPQLALPQATSSQAAAKPFARCDFQLSLAETQGLLALCEIYKATPFVLLASAWMAYLHRLTGQTDLNIATPFADRGDLERAKTVGYFVNPLVLRSQWVNGQSFAEYLAQSKAHILAAFAHGQVPLATVAQDQTEAESAELYQVLFNFLNTPQESSISGLVLGLPQHQIEIADLTAEALPIPELMPMLPLSLTAVISQGKLLVRLEFDQKIYPRELGILWSDGFRHLLSHLPEQLHQPLDRLEIQPHQLFLEQSQSKLKPFSGTPLQAAFETIARQQGDKPAITTVSGDISYRALNALANQMAHGLKAHGIQPGDRVGICLPRNTALIAAMLGTLKAGAAYVPLDPTYPAARLQQMAASSQAALVIGDPLSFGWACPCLSVDALTMDQPQTNPRQLVLPDQWAYLIFTSGSTGEPKGVTIAHHAATAMLDWAGKVFAAQAKQTVLAATSICFDLSIFEIFLPLSHGGRIALVENLLELPTAPFCHEVSLINTVPSVMDTLLHGNFSLDQVAVINLAGEPLSRALVARIQQRTNAQIFNLYGPSEDTTYSTFAAIDSSNRSPSIGKVIDGSAAYLLDKQGLPVPEGAIGELYLGGHGLSQGYFYRAQLTAAAFLPNPWAANHTHSATNGARMYRTGDLAWRDSRGDMHFMGRADKQVKIRGFRIELAEIETALRVHPHIREAAVVSRQQENGPLGLAAYVVLSANSPEDSTAWRKHLETTLPKHCIPQWWQVLAALPLLPNGKLDRESLPDLEPLSRTLAIPRNETEQALCRIWAKNLGIAEVGIDDPFFQLGGHSLSAARIVADMQSQLGFTVPLRTLLENPTIRSFSQVLPTLASPNPGPNDLAVSTASGTRPLSSAEQRLWFLQKVSPVGAAYHMAVAFEIEGAMDLQALRQAMAYLVAHHEVLRTGFEDRAGEPLAIVKPNSDVLPLEIHSWLEMEDLDQKSCQLLLRDFVQKPFDLQQPPLMRMLWLGRSANQGTLAFCLHHLVGDGWSVALLLNQWVDHYNALTQGESSEEVSPKIQASAFSQWQQQWLDSEQARDARNYWQTQLAQMVPLLDLPTDAPRPAIKQYAGAEYAFEIPAACVRAVEQFAQSANTTPFVTYLAIFKLLLARYSNQSDIAVGTPVANRSLPQFQQVVGLLANTLVLRSQVAADDSFLSFLHQVREGLLAALDHEFLPFDQVVETVQPPRHMSHTPLFQVMFLFEDQAPNQLLLNGLRAEPQRCHNGSSKFDLTLSMQADEQSFKGYFEYDSALFEPGTIAKMAAHFTQLMQTVFEFPRVAMGNLPIITPTEQADELASPTGKPSGATAGLFERFEAQAVNHPDLPAVYWKRETWTYGDLAERAQHIANYLAAQGAQPGIRVGLLLEREPNLIASIFACLRLGLCYVPLDLNYPATRNQYILNDAQATLLITDQDLLPAPSNCESLRLSQILEAKDLPHQAILRDTHDLPAYLIYTSGTTGKPKGVAITHGQATAMLDWSYACFTQAEAAITLATTSICFDLSIFEIFMPLTRGTALALAPRMDQLPAELAETVTLINTVPSAMEALLLKPPVMPNLRVVNTAGEPLRRSLVTAIYQKTTAQRVFNLYGPSEDTTYSTFAHIAADEDGEPTVGKAITGSQALVLSPQGQLQPTGVTGELFLAGNGVALGYFQRPASTAAKFLPHPFATEPGARMYATGDQVKKLATGELQFLGRQDQQVKLRGFRIELGEIEVLLNALEHVSQAAVVVREVAQDPRLIAFVAPKHQTEIHAADLKQACRAHLPNHMVPSYFEILPELPQTPNGKIDKKALVFTAEHEVPSDDLLPKDDALACKLQGIFQTLLGQTSIDPQKSFFELGGHSLLSMRAISRIETELGLTLSPQTFFENPSIAALTAILRNQQQHSLRPGPQPQPVQATYPLSPSQNLIWLMHELGQGQSYHIVGAFRVSGQINLPAMKQALAQLGQRHQALNLGFSSQDGKPVQIPGAGQAPTLEVVIAKDSVDRHLQELARIPFNLATGPLLKVWSLQNQTKDHYLLFSIHHLIADGWSLEILLAELSHYYRAATMEAAEPDLPEHTLQWTDLLTWQQEQLKTDAFSAEQDYWRTALAEIPHHLPLPYDRAENDITPGQGQTLQLDIDRDLLCLAQKLADQEQVTLQMVFLTAWATSLHLLTGANALAVGCPIANRNSVATEQMVGYLANTLVIGCHFANNPDFHTLLAQVKATSLAAFANRDLPFASLLEQTQTGQQLGQRQLFQAAFALWSHDEAVTQLGDLQLTRYHCDNQTAKFDLTLFLETRGEHLSGFLEHSSRLKPATAQRILDIFKTVMALFVRQPHAKVSQFFSENAHTWQQTQIAINQPIATPTTSSNDLLDDLRHWVDQHPQRPALVFALQTVSFAEMSRRADGIAHQLLAKGVGPEKGVALFFVRSPDLLIAMLAVLKTGAFFIPLDPQYPEDRLKQMLSESNPAIILTHGKLPPLLPSSDAEILNTDSLDAALGLQQVWQKVDGNHAAYMIFTSGSSGKPRGVIVTRNAITQLAASLDQAIYRETPSPMHISMNGPLAFDTSLKQWTRLAYGDTLVILPAEIRTEPDAFLTYCEDRRIQALDVTPSHLSVLLSAGLFQKLASLELLLLGGEAILPDLWQQLARQEHLRCFNMYGPTECTGDATLQAITPVHTLPVIGRVLPHLVAFGCQPQLLPLAMGMAGQLALGGSGLARGYAQNPRQTASRFVPNPFAQKSHRGALAPGSRLYLTGDQARFDEKGVWHYLGRLDHQVKVRGFRVELNEIETVLQQHPDVSRAYVTLQASGHQAQLVGYVAPEQASNPYYQGRERFELPNGLAVAHLNRNETEFLYREMFEEVAYYKHGIGIRAGDTVLDVGSNIGLFTLSTHFRAENLQFYCFEPGPEVFATLSANVALHQVKAKVFACGLGSTSQEKSYTYYPGFAHLSGLYADQAEELEVVRSFVAQQEGDSDQQQADAILDELILEKLQPENQTVQIRRLSDVIEEQGISQVNLLKINVEKAEWDVFQGIDDHHWPLIEQIAVEIHDVDDRLNTMVQFLETKGFSVFVEKDWSLQDATTTNYYLYARTGKAREAAAPVIPPTKGLLRANHLKTYLSTKLPDYMVPQTLVVLEHMPLTAHGKIDRSKLPAPQTVTSSKIAPQTPTQELVQAIWEEVLGREPLGIHEDFFDLGGHSLTAVQVLARVRNVFECQLEVKTLFETATIASLSAAIDFQLSQASTQDLPPLETVAVRNHYPLSFGQQRLWFLAQMQENQGGYNLPVALQLTGPLDSVALSQALQQLIARHPSLRTTFPNSDGQAVQVISSEIYAPLETLVLPEGKSPEALLAAVSVAPFDLAEGPLFKASLLPIAPEKHYLLMCMHHIIADGWSVGILIRELAALYAQQAHKEPAKLLPPARQYVDFAVWERQTLQGAFLENKLAFWQKLLGETPAFLDLPTDYPRPQLQSYRGETLSFDIRPDQVKAVADFAKSQQATPFMVYLSVYAMLLARISGQTQFNIGTPVANRSRQEIEQTVGLFLNSLALPVKAAQDPFYQTFLQTLRSDVLQAFGQAEVPFELVVEALKPARSLAYSPLFQVMFTLQNTPFEAQSLPGLVLEPADLPQTTAKFDITLVLYASGDGMRGLVEYNCDLFQPATMHRFIESYQHLLREVLNQPNQPLSKYQVLPAERRHQLLHTWNATQVDFDANQTALSGFLAHCQNQGDNLALIFVDRQWRYRELYQMAWHIGQQLQARGVLPGDRVGVYCHRCPEMLASLIAIQMVGAAYVPLDPTYPAERIRWIVEDAQLRCLVTHEGYASQFTIPTLIVEPLPQELTSPPTTVPALSADLPAYMIYTSGSTGKPKGVVVSHRNVVNFFTAMNQTVGQTTVDQHPVWLAMTSISFDISVLELFWTLSRGETIVLQPDRPMQDAELAKASQKSLEFGLFYFAADEQKQEVGNKYRLLLQGAAFADAHDFSAVWMPERHFHAFGGTFPNPSVAAAAVAATTQKVAIRSGSVVLPLHDPIRVAEEWSMVDNLSNGRVALSIASGWQPNDFVLAPDQFENRHQVMRDHLETLRDLWRGGRLERLNGVGKPFEASLFPQPVQKELPIWITAAGNPETFRYAGSIGAHILTHLLGQDLPQLKEKIAVYREAWHQAGHAEGQSHVTLMIHTFVDQDEAQVARVVEEPFKDYLRSSINLVKTMLPNDDLDLDSEENRELLIHQAYLRFSKTHALFGTPQSLLPLIQQIKAHDIDELACLIDFGVAEDAVLASLPHLETLKRLANQRQTSQPPELPYAAPASLIQQHGVTHLQCTPSLARIFLEDAELKALLPSLRQLLVGGEALPTDVATGLLEAGVGSLFNMYGPTETTIWSSVAEVRDGAITIGKPVANTQMIVADASLEPQPIGTTGDLWIGGDGVTPGYWQRPGLTASRFIPNPHGQAGSRLYLTGDRATFQHDGQLSYRGRSDDQVKLHGFRIELGEVETRLNQLAGVTSAVAVVRTDQHSDGRLVAYVVPENKLGLPMEPPPGFASKYQRYRLPNGLQVHHHDSRQLGALYQELFADEIYLKHDLQLAEGSVIFDVGANIGGFSMFAHYRAANAKIYAFEPIPPTFELLRDNLTFHGANIKLFNMGLSDRAETVSFTYYPHMSGLSSRFGDAQEDTQLAKSLISAQMQQGTLGAGLEGASQTEIDTFLAESYQSETHDCQLQTLSHIIEEEGLTRIDFLKIDVEKSECHVLRGIRPEDWPKIVQISMEIDGDENLAEVRELLTQHGFEIHVDVFMTGAEESNGSALKVYMLYARNLAHPQPTPQAKAPVLSKSLIRSQLAQVLPDYMLPSEVVFLPTLPLTPNGKVHKKALPAPSKIQETQTTYVAPRNELESQIATIWKAVLQQDQVGIRENFFELGGNSLLLTHVLTKLRETLAPGLSMVALFKYPTIAALAKYLSEAKAQTTPNTAKQQQRAEKRASDRRRLAGKRGRLARSQK